MTRLIDADSIPWLVEGVGEIPVITKEEIDQLPTVDIPIPVGESVGAIRCKDCRFSKIIDEENDWFECQHDKRVLHSDGYCSWAERKEE